MSALLWFAAVGAAIQHVDGLPYFASRTIYPKQHQQPVCDDHIKVDFEFDDSQSEFNMTIFCSSATEWFAVGFPDNSLYFDVDADLMHGYAIVYEDGDVSEYDITASGSNFGKIETLDKHVNQDDLVLLAAPSPVAGGIEFKVRRTLTSSDGYDFDLASMIECFPLLMTVAIGDTNLLSTSTENNFGSSYLYVYNETYALKTDVYTANWQHAFDTATDVAKWGTGAAADRTTLLDLRLNMNPATNIVSAELEITTTASVSFEQFSWALGFPDLADEVYYASNPITQKADYMLIQDSKCRGLLQTHNISEFMSPFTGAECLSVVAGDWTNCFRENPETVSTFASNKALTYTNIAGPPTVLRWEFEIPFQTCGYELSPAEFQTCRPLTITNFQLAASLNSCPDTAVAEEVHLYATVQIDDFPTNAPTSSPTRAPTTSPTTAPSTSPSDAPTASPISPTLQPTDPTDSPTFSPTTSPTQRPTRLPTVNGTTYDQPACPGMIVRHLDTLFPADQAMEQFNQQYYDVDQTLPVIYNQRRAWSNGVLEMHFVDRFEDGGDWVITNGSYSALSIADANRDNVQVYTNETDVDANPLPGPYPAGYVYFDHFAHDNVVSKPEVEATLYFACLNTRYPTAQPSQSPTTADPTAMPTTSVPTRAPTANCTTLRIPSINEDLGCNGIMDPIVGDYLLSGYDFYGRAFWYGVGDAEGSSIYYAILHQEWAINNGQGFVAVVNDSRRHPPGYDDDLLATPFQLFKWDVIDVSNPFVVDCEIRLKYFCYGTGVPTPSPTRAPTTAEPTTGAPTQSPTDAPTAAPTFSPTDAPTDAPTVAPTASPTLDCLGLELIGTDSALDGLYRRLDEMEAGRHQWQKNHDGDGHIFWSTSVFHRSWIIYTAELNQHWLAQQRPFGQPLLQGEWDFYLGSAPIISAVRTLNFVCYSSLPPTVDPTAAPSAAPTAAPSFSPTSAPTDAPTFSPTRAPTTSPTFSPTTLPPTMEPTAEPTFIPTDNPTAEACEFLLVTNPDDVSALQSYVGIFVYDRDENEWRKEFDDGSQFFYALWGGGARWYIEDSSNVTADISVESDRPLRPPYAASAWQFADDETSQYTLLIDCSNSSAPTSAPTAAPSAAPTGSPTSSCRGLYFRNTENASFAFNGWFRRRDEYDINGHYWWQSHNALIEWRDNAWTLSEIDGRWRGGMRDDEDPVMLTNEGMSLLSPPSGEWILLDRETGSAAIVEIICGATRPPTMEPTSSPTMEPTVYVPMTWVECFDRHTYFTFVSDKLTGARSVYWPVPVVNPHLYDANVTVEPEVASGDPLDPGQLVISYTATDTYGESIYCNVSLIVVSGLSWNNTYDWCKRVSMNIHTKFNLSYVVLEDSADFKDVPSELNTYRGVAYSPGLVMDGEKCYVTAEQIAIREKVEIISRAPSSTFLGIEAPNLLWELLVVIAVLCVIGAYSRCCYEIHQERKQAQAQKDEANTAHLLPLNQPVDAAQNDVQEQANESADVGTGAGTEVQLAESNIAADNPTEADDTTDGTEAADVVPDAAEEVEQDGGDDE